MATPNSEFNNVTSIRAEALGEPGNRTFRIVVDSESISATMWLEKEQLFQLAMAISQLQATLPKGGGAPEGGPGGGQSDTANRLEFKIGKLVLGHEGTSDRFIIDAHDVEMGEEAPPAVRLWGERPMLASFAEESLRLCAAGRPLCPLCGAPIDPDGHICARSNGHQLEDLTEV
jgi:uncharacterized repeat protein (TIGR03847 family)